MAERYEASDAERLTAVANAANSVRTGRGPLGRGGVIRVAVGP